MFIAETAKHSAITTVLQLCVFPRCCFTSIDAIYCAKFLYIMHNLKTPNFSSLICYDRVFSQLDLFCYWSVARRKCEWGRGLTFFFLTFLFLLSRFVSFLFFFSHLFLEVGPWIPARECGGVLWVKYLERSCMYALLAAVLRN